METILQFGAGNFLRAFIDLFVQEQNDAGRNAGRIVVVQSTDGERARLLNAQNGRYHVLVRGMENDAKIERVQTVESISRALIAQHDWQAVLDVARSPHLRCIVSNTTEAGLALDEAEPPNTEDAAPHSHPAKLLSVLRARFEAGQPGLLILPCELVENNADRTRELVWQQAERWSLTSDAAFRAWLFDRCAWANTLVDRIVSGKPGVHPLLAEDALLTVTEPYQFWAMEDRPGTEMFAGHPAVVRAADIRPYALRKVRILNGAHSALVAKIRKEGRSDLTFVREAVADPEMGAWLRGLLFEEIVPTMEGRVDDADGFARQTLTRFENPFLDHRLSDILLHHDKKVPVRLVPTRDEFTARFGHVPARLDEAIHAGER